jgi:uncharacterized protein
MGMYEEIEKLYIDARKKQDKFIVNVLSMLISDLKYEKINKKIDLDDGNVTAFLQKTLKQKKDVMAEFEKAERTDLSEKEKKEIEYLSTLMPAMLTENEIKEIIDAVEKELEAASPSDMGRVIKEVMARAKGRAEGAAVRNLVAESLKNG